MPNLTRLAGTWHALQHETAWPGVAHPSAALRLLAQRARRHGTDHHSPAPSAETQARAGGEAAWHNACGEAAAAEIGPCHPAIAAGADRAAEARGDRAAQSTAGAGPEQGLRHPIADTALR